MARDVLDTREASARRMHRRLDSHMSIGLSGAHVEIIYCIYEVHITYHTPHTTHHTPNTKHYTLHTAHCTPHTTHRTPHTIHHTAHITSLMFYRIDYFLSQLCLHGCYLVHVGGALLSNERTTFFIGSLNECVTGHCDTEFITIYIIYNVKKQQPYNMCCCGDRPPRSYPYVEGVPRVTMVFHILLSCFVVLRWPAKERTLNFRGCLKSIRPQKSPHHFLSDIVTATSPAKFAKYHTLIIISHNTKFI